MIILWDGMGFLIRFASWFRSQVVSKVQQIMDTEHSESAQWPSTQSPAEQCCGSCFSAHGCMPPQKDLNHKPKNCPARNGSGAVTTLQLPALQADPFKLKLADLTAGNAAGCGTVKMGGFVVEGH